MYGLNDDVAGNAEMKRLLILAGETLEEILACYADRWPVISVEKLERFKSAIEQYQQWRLSQ